MRILHVDRSSFFKKIVSKIAMEKGFEYLDAQSIEGTFEILDKEKVDLLLISKELDKESGEDLIIELNNSKHKKIPVMVITSEESLEIRKRFFSLGIVDYILKQEINENRFNSYLDHLIEMNKSAEEYKTLKVAILDDSKISLQVISSILYMHGFKDVSTFTDPREFIDSSEEFAVYFVDIIMPGMAGEEVVLKLRKRHPQSVIIIISSIDNCKTISSVLNAGADDYIMKPFNGDIFMARLKAAARTQLMMKQLEEMSMKDSLCNVYNHSYIRNYLDNLIKGAESGKTTFSVLMVDIDNFKKVNDTYGHQVGDGVLTQLVELMEKEFPDKTVLGRYGGEEFMLVLHDISLSEAASLAENLRRKVEGYDFTDVYEPVTISGGLAAWSGEEGKFLINKADDLLYFAKNNGRNQISR